MVWVQRRKRIVNWGSKMKINTIIFAVLSSVLLNACAHDPDNPHAYLPDAQTEAAQVYIEQCGACHAAPHPRRLNIAAWKNMITVMDQRRQERDYPPLTDAQRKKLMAYLAEHAR